VQWIPLLTSGVITISSEIQILRDDEISDGKTAMPTGSRNWHMSSLLLLSARTADDLSPMLEQCRISQA